MFNADLKTEYQILFWAIFKIPLGFIKTLDDNRLAFLWNKYCEHKKLTPADYEYLFSEMDYVANHKDENDFACYFYKVNRVVFTGSNWCLPDLEIDHWPTRAELLNHFKTYGFEIIPLSVTYWNQSGWVEWLE